MIRTVALPIDLGAKWETFGWPSKAPADDLEYRVDATDWLLDAKLTIGSVDCHSSPGLSVSIPVISAGIISMRITDGAPGTICAVRLLLHLSSSEELEVVVRLPIRAAGPDGLAASGSGNGPTNTADSAALPADSTTLTADAA